jgi:hypothetical protein
MLTETAGHAGTYLVCAALRMSWGVRVGVQLMRGPGFRLPWMRSPFWSAPRLRWSRRVWVSSVTMRCGGRGSGLSVVRVRGIFR